jgi:transcriptional regulator with XRE-family HTH domain
MPRQAKSAHEASENGKATSEDGKGGNPALREWAAQLVAHGERLGVTTQDICDRLGITRSYFNVFRRGAPAGTEPSRDILRRSAEFLDVSFVQVLLLAGVLGPQDFYLSSTLEGNLDKALTSMRADDEWVSYLPTPEQWKDLPLNVRVGIALLYERASYNVHKGTYKAVLEHIEIEVPVPDEADDGASPAARRRTAAAKKKSGR